MARNEEKALNRFITMKSQEKKKPNKDRRPFLAIECHDLLEADKWRQQIMREICRKVAEIQNEGLGEDRLRDLNDKINKLIREKVDWEKRIVELRGMNFIKYSLDGKIVDVPGYRYFGAAKKLRPGVESWERVHVPLPDEKEIQMKKWELLGEYEIDELLEEEREAKAMLNILMRSESNNNQMLTNSQINGNEKH